MESKKYLILAFYHFTPIENPHEEVAKQHAFFENRDVTSRIYIAHEGINGQMSASVEDAEAYMQWLKQDPRFQNIDFKCDPYHEHILPRKTIKFREQLVALDLKPDLTQRGTPVPPKEWKEMLETRDEDTVLIDVRNDYEWKVGHFEGADLPDLEMFREFPLYAEKLKKNLDTEKTKVMMYCTGGIRCEFYSALLKKAGFKNVFQLQGGVINYGHQEGGAHWRGKLFVFDDRLAIPLTEEGESEVISCCHHCEIPSDTYYNCANMDCNALFVCCLTCAEKYGGCCSEDCTKADRVRPYEKREKPKPFRKWYHYS
ncbi:MAG TPA: rhodanese-related sulfurtransferase [Rhabdochlamydiaceae bacterium]|nr:rhodanese-related sulfurtransferase [Rhabdochlamydiaceae bacterium]